MPNIYHSQFDTFGDLGGGVGMKNVVKKWISRILVLPWLVFGNWQGYAWRVGQARLKWDLCPLCNSDAPLIYDCPVCRDYEKGI